MTQKLFEPYSLGSITLANRIVMAPMTRNRALGNIPNELMAEYYQQRAGAGLIVTEGTSPSADGLGYARISGLYDDAQVRGWKLTTDAVHEKGGHIFVQLMHTGRIFHELNLPSGSSGVAPSAVRAAGDMWTDQEQMKPNGMPRELTPEELARVRDDFIASAVLARDAGFDGVELHGANGYLLEQFLNPHTNHRNDQYGGSVENRARFVLEVARGVADATAADRVGIRLSPWSVFNDMAHYPHIHDTYLYLAQQLQDIGVVYLHLLRQASMSAPGASLDTLHAIRKAFSGTLILNGGLHTVEGIESVLDTREADLVSIGRPYVSNPDMVERLRNDIPLAEPVPATFYAPGPKGFSDGYTDYPDAAHSPDESVAALAQAR